MSRINRRTMLQVSGLGAMSMLARCSQSNRASPRPNIVIVILDDLGYADIAAYNKDTDIVTPHIDSIATNGIRFTDAYMGASVCSPSRACIMTGRFPCTFGYMYNPFSAPETYGLPTNETTIADVLRSAGYRTGMIGKWHLGNKPEFLPTNRGFDEFFGSPDGLLNYVAPDPNSTRVRNGLKLYRGTTPIADSSYITDAYSRESCDFIVRNRKKPFFLIQSHAAPHAPLEAPQRLVGRFPHIKDPARRLYAAVVSAIDDAVGRLVDQLKVSGVYENTLLMLFSDNGGSIDELPVNNHPLSGGKGTLREGGLRVPFLLQWPAKLPKGTVHSSPICATDILPTCAAAAGIQPYTRQPIHGINLLTHMQDISQPDPSRCLYWAQGKEAAMRRGDWKFVKRAIPGRFELFNLTEDVSESRNLAGKQTRLADEMQKLLETWVSDLPKPMWDWVPKPPRVAPNLQSTGGA